jgi:tRNA threonylcarbamoyladenosine biosynthesis protein TsaE
MERTTAATAQGELRSDGVPATQAIGRALGREARRGTFIALIGELGAGKTQLAKGVAEGLEVPTIVNSPTFVLMNEHVGRLRLYHVDAYRLAQPEEAVDAGLIEERQSDGVVVVEWADRLEGWLPADRLEITITGGVADASVRTLRWTAIGTVHAHLADAALDSR